MVHPLSIMNQVRDEGNCGEVTNRGEEACECARLFSGFSGVGLFVAADHTLVKAASHHWWLKIYEQKSDIRPVRTGE